MMFGSSASFGSRRENIYTFVHKNNQPPLMLFNLKHEQVSAGSFVQMLKLNLSVCVRACEPAYCLNLVNRCESSHLLPELFVFGLQALAVSAPRSVELDQHVFAVIVDDGVEVLSHEDLNRNGLVRLCLRCAHSETAQIQASAPDLDRSEHQESAFVQMFSLICIDESVRLNSVL